MDQLPATLEYCDSVLEPPEIYTHRFNHHLFHSVEYLLSRGKTVYRRFNIPLCKENMRPYGRGA